MNQAIVFGAGAIGLGFLGSILSQSNYKTTFVDVDPQIISAICTNKHYKFNIAGPSPKVVTVKNVNGIPFSDREKIFKAIKNTDAVFTAAGGNALSAISEVLAEGLVYRLKKWRPLNVICCENLHDPSAILRDGVLRYLEGFSLSAKDLRTVSEETGFSNTVISKMCKKTSVKESVLQPIADGVDVVIEVETEGDLLIDANSLVEPKIRLKNVQLLGSYQFEAERNKKTFAHNGGHATLAYLGKLKGYDYIWEAGADEGIKTIFNRAMICEIGEALVKKYRRFFSMKGYEAYVNDIFFRMTDRYFCDKIDRGIRSSMEKIGGSDARLTRTARFVMEQGLIPLNFCLTIAAGFLINEIKMDEPAQTVSLSCDLDPSKDGCLINVIVHAYEALKKWKAMNCPNLIMYLDKNGFYDFQSHQTNI